MEERFGQQEDMLSRFINTMKQEEVNKRLDIIDVKLMLILEALKIDKEKIRQRLEEIDGEV